MYIIFHLSCLSIPFFSCGVSSTAAAAIAEATFKKDERGKIVIVWPPIYFFVSCLFFYFLLFWVFFSFGVGFIHAYNTSFHLNYSNVFGEEEKTGSNAFFKRVYIASISLSRLSSPLNHQKIDRRVLHMHTHTWRELRNWLWLCEGAPDIFIYSLDRPRAYMHICTCTCVCLTLRANASSFFFFHHYT